MAITNITPLPAAPSRNDAPQDFTNKADRFVGALSKFSVDINSIITGINEAIPQIQNAAQNAQTATNAATTASTAADAAASYSASALGSAEQATQAARSAQDSTVNIRDFLKLVSNGDYTAAVQAAINRALSLNIRRVRIDGMECYCANRLYNRSNVVFVGSGKLTGPGAYRRQVIPDTAPVAPLKLGDLIPAMHMRKFILSGAPRVVVVGSSTGTWSPDALDASATFYNILITELRSCAQARPFAAFNRCIGGMTYNELNTRPPASITFPSWYTDTSRNWIDYVGDLVPDLVVVIMGSNDGPNMTYTNLNSVTTKLKALPSAPDIVFVTQPGANLEAHDNYYDYAASKDAQEGRDYAAGLIRSYARYNGYGLLDSNRMLGAILDGRDILDTYSARISANVALGPKGRFDSTVECRDFSMGLLVSGTSDAIHGYFNQTDNPVRLNLGRGASNSVQILSTGATRKFRLRFYIEDGNAYSIVDTDLDIPTSDFVLQISKAGTEFNLWIASQQEDRRVKLPILAHGGLFTPSIGYFNLDTGPFTTLVYFNVGVERPYMPIALSREIWGDPNGTASTQFPYGGNGVNHLSSIGTRALFTPLIEGKIAPLISNVIQEVSNANGKCIRFSNGDQICTHTVQSPTTREATGSIYRTPGFAWTFPMPFIDSTTKVVPVAEAGNSWATASQIQTTNAAIRLFCTTNDTSAINIRLFAIGKWR